MVPSDSGEAAGHFGVWWGDCGGGDVSQFGGLGRLCRGDDVVNYVVFAV